MIKINLVSKEDKESLKWEKINRIAVSYGLKVVIIQAFFAISLAATMVYLNYERDMAKNQLTMIESTKETLEIKEMEDSLKKYEKNLKVVTNIHQNHIRWTDVIDAFSFLVSKGIKISSIRFRPYEQEVAGISNKAKTKVVVDKGRYIFEVTGEALKREDLVVFENQLNETKVFNILETGDPAYNKYVNSENIGFKFNFEVAREDLAKISGE
ncbi:MAG: hypothetical protein WC788_04140 [Candidatus Paceibacterota bacterium]|jgi:hypothetical protein